MKVASPFVIVQSVMVILFRVAPSIESAFLQGSSFGSLLVGPAAANLYTVDANNVLDPAKAGGLFVNANVASMVEGVIALLCFAFAGLRHRYMVFTGGLALISVFFTGSKTGLALAIMLPVLAGALYPLVERRFELAIPLLALGVVGTLLLPEGLGIVFPNYGKASSDSFDTRETLWTAAASLFQQHPIAGLGYGGWAEVIGQYVGRSDYPPTTSSLPLGQMGALCWPF